MRAAGPRSSPELVERDFGRGYLDLEAGLWHRRGAGVRATTKRQPPVPLPRPLLAHLRRWRANGAGFAVEFNGRPVERMDKAFRQLVKDCGFGGEAVVPHTLRHTAITWAMQAGWTRGPPQASSASTCRR